MLADLLRQLPSVNDLLNAAQDLVAVEGHERVVQALRESLDEARTAIRAGQPVPTTSDLIRATRQHLQPSAVLPSSFVLNATGVIIHTNLGRAVLSKAAQEALVRAAGDYSPLEFDLATGQRGRRGQAVEDLLCEVTGAQAALVVNNCAAATVLMLSAIAQGKSVVISRGQLVEIGGGFRIPEILEQSGARLLEVGTTNRTRRSDYEKAISRQSSLEQSSGVVSSQNSEPRTQNPEPATLAVGAILRAHSSNFKIIGFTEEVTIEDLVAVAAGDDDPAGNRQSSIANRQSSIPVLDDLGSGALLDTAQYGLAHEPMVQESVRAGAAIVAFSGDKLLGGPQAGILVGRREEIERCRRHPLARAVRADKFTLAALGATILHYARGEAARDVPVWRMIAMSREEIDRRARVCVAALSPWLTARGLSARIVDGESTIGGGSLPGETLPTRLIALQGASPDALAADLRRAPVPIISRIRDDQVLLDLRTILDDEALLTSMRAC